MEILHLSVRGLVEFTMHGEDIFPAGGSIRDMQEGMLGHKARQSLLGEGWQSEVPLQLVVPVDGEDAEMHLVGRMDAFCDGVVPVIEEIKLWQGKEGPTAPFDAHQAQAVCYGHMLCANDGVENVLIRVVYVDRQGRVRGQFDTPMTAAQCRDAFFHLVENYLRRWKLVTAHRRARDASLHHLQFPFASFRPGQRDMAAQVYTAIRRQKRLFASMPTGTGKSVAALFPALKALGEGLTSQVYYLTARTTQRQGPVEALKRMRTQPLHLWTLVLDAKDKQCPAKTLCHPDWCDRAKGHFLRDHAAMEEMMAEDDWSPENIRRMADRHNLCPFEFSLSLAEIADLTICDYNYALDPAVHIQRIFDKTSDVTLLIDEAHHLLSRVRDMLSGTIDGGAIRKLRTTVGKVAGRRHPLYKGMTAVLKALDDLPVRETEEEGRMGEPPYALDNAAQEVADAFIASRREKLNLGDAGESFTETMLNVMSYIRARRRDPLEYAFLWQGQKNRTLTAFALEVGAYFRETTQKLQGVVCFSATMDPLEDMKTLLGGDEGDACFAMPSPFPKENLLLLQKSVNTRYTHRDLAVGEIVRAIREVVCAKPGRYMVFFPSFAFMKQAAKELDLPCQVQASGMSEEERRAFLAPYTEKQGNMLSLCVLGGIFSEGIDLPGDALDGVVIVGVGLPQVNIYQQTLREHYESTLGNGFLYAYMIPGMQKVAQAVGRVIRTETDVGVALLLDDRYLQSRYARLFPPHWQLERCSPRSLSLFWKKKGATIPAIDK